MSVLTYFPTFSKQPVVKTAWWWGWIMLTLLGLAGNQLAAQPYSLNRDVFEPFSFVLTDEPQIGGGNGFEQGSYQRLIDQAKILNHLPVDLIIMPGNLVHANNPYQWKLFLKGLKQYTAPTYLIPGDQDVDSLLDLQRYRDRLGFDYDDFVIRNCAFIMINSQTVKDQKIDANEYAQQWRWLEKTLDEHFRAKRRYLFLVMNHPLSRDTVDEKTTDEYWPRQTRDKLLGLIQKYKVSAVLTANFQQSTQGSGYRLFYVGNQGIEEQYQSFEPSVPKHWQFMGIKGWNPPILKMDPVQMGLVSVYILAMLLCYRTWGHWKYIRYARPARFWAFAGLFMLFLGLNEAFALNDLCLMLGINFDYLPMAARGGITLPVATLLLLPIAALGALRVYHRYYIVAKYGWIALAGMVVGAGQWILSLSAYEPWLSWTQTWQWSVTGLVSSLVVCEMALLSASFADKKARQPVKMSRPRQVPRPAVTQPRPVLPAKAAQRVVKMTRRSEPRPARQMNNDVMMALMIRTGRRP